jgi:hypothetical protein
MSNLDAVIKKMTNNVQERCIERIKAAEKTASDIPTLKQVTEEYGVSSILKRKRGL